MSSQESMVHQFAILALKVRHSDLRKPFQAGTENLLFGRRARRATPRSFPIARQETDDEIAFPKRPGLQDEGFAHASGHITETM
jgi:hypothetical protein